LALGAGGITGIAWLLGVLEALRDVTGWDPADADVVSGTSAGAVAAAVLTGGVPPRRLLQYAEDDGAMHAAAPSAMNGRSLVVPTRAWPGSLALGLTGLTSLSPWQRVSSVAGLLPSGRRPTDEIQGLVDDMVPGGWPAHTELWLHACDYRTGERVTFGAPGAPEAKLGCAVAASAAVPAYYEPVCIGGRRYVDGGLWSFTNADALANAECDLVVCLAPFSSSARDSITGTAALGAARAATRLRLRQEIRQLRNAGTEVVIVEPTSGDLRAMGLNPMKRQHSRAVLDTAYASAVESIPPLLAGVELPLVDGWRESRAA